ncbi:MAG: extracellular solute-binding protein [Eubacteriales bacterium]
MKKLISIAAALAMSMSILLTGCQTAQTATTAAATTAGDATSAVTTAAATTAAATTAGEKKNIKFYGKIVEYTGGPEACDKMQEILKDKYNIESLQVDWGNLEKVIRTGIASGQPCDVYEYWTQAIKPFAVDGMALDLTPYLEADGGAWKNTLNQAGLSSATIDGKTYAVPITSNFSLFLANKDLLDANGITIPENWTWDQFLTFCQQCQDKGIFPIGHNSDNRQGDWFIRNGLLSAAVSAGKEVAMQNGEIPATDAIFTDVLTNVKNIYDAGYVYPGEGAVTVKLDEVKAAFYQGKTALMSSVSAGAAATAAEAPFKTVVIPWPSMGKTNAVLGGCDGLFIPSNVADPEAAVEVLKTYTSAEVQSIMAEGGIPVANTQVVASNPITQKAIDISSAVYPFEFISLNTKLNEYSFNTSLSDLILNGGVKTVQDTYEQLRTAQ